jgi:hypothetical protein
MSDGQFLVALLFAALIFGRLSGIRTQLKRIADVCERADKRNRPL